MQEGTLEYRETVLLETELHRFVKVTADKRGVSIWLATVGASDMNQLDCRLEWDRVTDVEHLAGLFAYERVCVFAVLVKLLGDAYRAKDLL